MNCLKQHTTMDGKYAKKIAALDSKQRELLIQPEKFISHMPIKHDDTVFDVGAGTGFFTIPMAKSTTGTVYAMDTDRNMLNAIQDKAGKAGLSNIELINENIEDAGIPVGSVDFAMASLILHEIRSLRQALNNIYAALKTGGYLECIEYEKDDMIVEGPPMSIRIDKRYLENELQLIGFDIVDNSNITEALYSILAVKRDGK